MGESWPDNSPTYSENKCREDKLKQYNTRIKKKDQLLDIAKTTLSS